MAQDLLADGFVDLCIDPSLNAFDGNCRVLIEGQYIVNPLLPVAIVPDKTIKITSTRDIDAMFGAGSVLSIMLRTAFCECPSSFFEIHALPRLDAAGSTKAEYTLTVTGPATSDGNVDIFLGNGGTSFPWAVSVPVQSGDTATAIAAAIAAAVPASFPYTVTAAAGVVTFVAKNAGTVGNYLNPVINWHGRANWLPNGVTFAVAQTVVGAGDPPAINYADVTGTCCFSCYTTSQIAVLRQRELRDHIRDAWSCDKPQCFGHGYTYSVGTLGQTLLYGDNSAELSRVAFPVNDVNFPWQVVAAYMARSCCTACTNPELSTQGRDNGELRCIKRPQTCTQPWNNADLELLGDQAFVTYLPKTGGGGALTSLYIVNDVTNYLFDDEGRPNATFRDTNSRRLAQRTALAIAEKLQEFNGLGLFTKNTRIREGTRGTNPRLILAAMHAWSKSEVGRLFSEFDNIEQDVTLQTDFQRQPPCQGMPGKLWLNYRYRPPVRLSQIAVTMQPKLLDNCR